MRVSISFFLVLQLLCLSLSLITQLRVNNPKNVACALSYAQKLSSIIGEKYHTMLQNMLLKSPNLPMHQTKAQIVLNVGIGSTGTKSLFLAMQQLNVTAAHFRLYSQNCTSLYRNSSRIVMEGLHLTYDPFMVFWGE